MNYIWEEGDIKVGRFFVKDKALLDNATTNYVESTMGMIGYHADRNCEGKLTTISIADGMVGGGFTALDLVQWLNDAKYVPAHHDLVVKVFENRRQRTEGHA